MRIVALVAVMVLLGACSRGDESPPPDTTAVSSPCAGASDLLDRAVCEDEDLRAMESDMTRLYQRVLARVDHTAKTSLRAEHAEWRRGLAVCLGEPPESRRACLDERYNARLVELGRRLHDTSP